MPFAGQIHASCIARDDAGVLLLGPSGAGKSDLALRLIDRGFILVADDRVDIAAGIARPPPALAGLLEIRGLGIVRLAYLPAARLALAVMLAADAERLPMPSRDRELDVPRIALDPAAASAPARVALALDAALGRCAFLAGAFATPADAAPA
jgi:HPr kinase/phosphorylase